MIEEFTPQVLMITLTLVILVSPSLTLVISAALMWRYRRAVARAMAEPSGTESITAAADWAGGDPAAGWDAPDRAAGVHGADLYRHAMRAPWRNAMRYMAGGVAFALVLAGATTQVYPSGLGLSGFAIAVWIYAWPIVLALPLIVPQPFRIAAAAVVTYLVVYALLGLWAGTVENLSEYRFGAVFIPARSTVTPAGMLRTWLTTNAAPTLLILLCLNRRVRAVAPLVLALVTSIVAGFVVVVLALFSPRGADAVMAVAISLGLDKIWLVGATCLLALGCLGLVGWLLARGIARAYCKGRLSDQSLLLDALWLLFASTYGMWLAWGGAEWIASPVVAFLAYRLVWTATARFARPQSTTGIGLTFLRVFSLGRRSEALFEAVAGYWRHLGSVQLITGPDLAHKTVQPHQFLDFVSGGLSRHFVRDDASLTSRLAEYDFAPAADGRFRINNLFCHADSWQAALPSLVRGRNIVLMDLRSFSASNAGCIHEIRFLVQTVPVEHFVLVVDDTTDMRFLDSTLQEAVADLFPGASNSSTVTPQSRVFQIGDGRRPLQRLLRGLCDAAGGVDARGPPSPTRTPSAWGIKG
ncbi:MAG: hypothetical protein Q7J47_15365 [Azoarcus sp.]|nr:hypothetical protein [Azoarcus sp.]